MSKLKILLFDLCRESILHKIERLQMLIHEAQQSANEETKSSAGDKYETGRAMAQLEIEKYATQLAELQKQGQELQRISSATHHDRVGLGALVETTNGNFFVAVNAGEFVIDGKKIFAVSPQSPIAQKMNNLSKDDSFTVNGRAYKIVSLE